MIDNLRRTLSAPFVLLSLVAGWTLPPAAAAMWTAFIVATIATAPMLPFVTGIIPRRRDISKRSHILAVGKDLVWGTVAARHDADLAGASGVADDRRNFADALPLVRESSTAARMDDRGAGQAHDASRRSRLLRDDGRRAGARHSRLPDLSHAQAAAAE